MVTVRELSPGDAPACDAVIRTLPDFFSYEPAGFATWEPKNDYTAEITWMAVDRSRRHRGVGTAIVEAVCEDMRAAGFRLALAMTSAADKEGGDTYEPTRRFWLSRNSLPLVELDIWETNLALRQVRPLG